MAADSIQNGVTVLKETKRRSKATKTVGNAATQLPKVPSEETPSNSNNNHYHNTNEKHLPPIVLTLVVFACSSIVLILCLRDFWMTGKNIFGHHDDMFLVRTT
jgi:hypothetical protein